ncbi:hypothetical protein L2089_15505 [Paenibacillus hunanensis]|uniref:hypothetical protein n=1 Tax=Paenibacillus hunanensis TaxID=539262 RepID=UPI002026676E|nr:hypothetical protein [Paenibacillus hunanensis]MCL9662100.1 hypothetical protein [Paenibacillus hunanensis]
MNTEENVESHEQNKNTKKKWIIFGCVVTCLLIVFGVTSYIKSYNEHIAKIDYYIDQADYISAHQEANKLFPKSYNQRLTERVNILYEVQRHSPSYAEYDNSQDRTTWEIHSLIDGLVTYEQYKKAGEDYNISQTLDTLRGKYLMDLELYSISQKSATEVATAALDKREQLINKLVIQAKEFEAKKISSSATSNVTPSNSSSTAHFDSPYTREELENDPLAPSTNPNDYNANGDYVPADGISSNPGDYNYDGEYKQSENMTKEEKDAELADMLSRALEQ